MDSLKKVILAAKAADDKKAHNIKVLELKGLTMITDYFLICSGGSKPQTQAISNEIEAKLAEQNVKILRREGYQEGRCVLLDFGDFVAHVFMHEERDFYGIERLWGDAKEIDINNIVE